MTIIKPSTASPLIQWNYLRPLQAQSAVQRACFAGLHAINLKPLVISHVPSPDKVRRHQLLPFDGQRHLQRKRSHVRIMSGAPNFNYLTTVPKASRCRGTTKQPKSGIQTGDTVGGSYVDTICDRNKRMDRPAAGGALALGRRWDRIWRAARPPGTVRTRRRGGGAVSITACRLHPKRVGRWSASFAR
jgi:hypothetical protein